MTGAPIEGLSAAAFTLPTDGPESDGTLEWSATTMVTVEARAGGRAGFGYTYGDAAAAALAGRLADVVLGLDAFDVPAAWSALRRASRNLGRPGAGSMAIAAIDTALWDLKARLLDVPLARLFGSVRESVPVYGSGGFTSYDEGRLAAQLGAWAASGITRVKMKVGREPAADARRVRAAREAIGPAAELFVDANGAYGRKQALAQAVAFAESGVSWFEEPVSSDDLEGLALIRDRAPAGMDVSAGEYGFDSIYFRRMLAAGSVDVLQADATRCAGYTGFFAAAAVADAFSIPLSSHTAPSLHLPACCAVPGLRHLEYFYDHARVERILLDGAPEPAGGSLRPDLSRPGNGLELKRADAERYRAD